MGSTRPSPEPPGQTTSETATSVIDGPMAWLVEEGEGPVLHLLVRGASEPELLAVIERELSRHWASVRGRHLRVVLEPDSVLSTMFELDAVELGGRYALAPRRKTYQTGFYTGLAAREVENRIQQEVENLGLAVNRCDLEAAVARILPSVLSRRSPTGVGPGFSVTVVDEAP